MVLLKNLSEPLPIGWVIIDQIVAGLVDVKLNPAMLPGVVNMEFILFVVKPDLLDFIFLPPKSCS